MPVSLAQAALGAASDIDYDVIDEFRKSNYLLDRMTFDDVVNPAGGGATLTYGYTRLITQPTAAFRAINAEYTPQEVTKAQYTTALKPLGGSFQIDRVLDNIARGRETALQMSQKIKATNATFNQAVILGDSAVDANSFDGLSKALTGSTTELNESHATTYVALDLTAVDTQAEAFAAMARIDELLAAMDELPDALLMNATLRSRLRTMSRYAQIGEGAYTEDQFGRRVDSYAGIPLIDLGNAPGVSTPIIPIETRDPDVGGAGGNVTGLTDLYAVKFGLDAFHGVTVTGGQLIQTWPPDFSTAGAVKTGEVELGPVAVVLKRTLAAAVLRNIKVS